MFDITKEDLKDLLKKVDKGKLQLPEFQRSYVWNDSDVRALLASILKGFPVGALLTLQTGGELRFKPRMLEGAPDIQASPEELLLDGQQRMTSLYQSSFSKAPVRTRNEKKIEVERYYYVDINKALEPDDDVEDAIVSVPADRVVKSSFGRNIVLDVSTKELEFQQDLFPLNQVFDPHKWLYGWQNYWTSRGRDVSTRMQEFHEGLVDRFSRYEMPIIRLSKSNSREAICLVFEKVNVGGKKLDAFELVTAIYAADRFDLREDWDGATSGKRGRKSAIVGHPNRRDVLAELASTDFLQACTLLHTRAKRLDKIASGSTGKEIPAVSCKRDALLALPLTSYKAYADGIQRGFVSAGDFLNEWKIIWHRDVPYPPQIVAIASVVAILGDKAETAAAKEKLSRWFWSVTFGELYGSSTEGRLANDVPELVEWITGERSAPPRSVDEAIFQKHRLLSLRSRLSAAYKGLHALIMARGCQDFITGKPTDIMTFFSQKIDIHHVFPQDWCKKQGIKPEVFNSIVNKTPLSKKTNILISGDAPSVYLRRIEERHGISPDKLDNILRSHWIEPSFLRADDFRGFFDHRMSQLAKLVGDAMGKPVVSGEGANEVEHDVIEPEEIEENESLDDNEAVAA